MLRAHEKLIILGAFVRSVRVSAPLQSSQVSLFFAEILWWFLHVVFLPKVCVLPPTHWCYYANCSTGAACFASVIRHGWGWSSSLVIQSMPSLWHFGKNPLWPRVENEAVVVGGMSNHPSPPIECFDQTTPEMYIHTTCNEVCKCSSTLCFVFMKPQVGRHTSSYWLVHFLPHPSRIQTHYSPSPWGRWVANYTSRVLTLLCLLSSHFPKRRIFGR